MNAALLKWIMGLMLMLVILAIFSAVLFFDVIKTDYNGMIIGGLISAFTLIVQFFFRKSSGAEKNSK